MMTDNFWKERTQDGFQNPTYDKVNLVMGYITLVLLALTGLTLLVLAIMCK